MTVFLNSFRDMNVTTRLDITENILREPIFAILAKHGPLTPGNVQYFLEHDHGIHLEKTSARMALRTLELLGIQEIQLDKEHGFHIAYCLDGEENRQPTVPVPDDYERAYLDLWLRYQGIRQHPELAAAPEGYLDAIFNPRKDEEEEMS